MEKGELERLKNTPILEVANSLGLPLKGGKVTHCYNPAGHKNGDRNPSLSLDFTRNRYKCFSCGVNGSVIDLVMNYRGLDFTGAVEYLGGNLERRKTAYKGRVTRRTQQPATPKSKEGYTPPKKAYSEIYEDIYSYSVDTLQGGEAIDKESLEYLQGRGFSEETLYNHFIFTLQDPKALDSYLRGKYSLDELRKAGVYKGDYFLFSKCKIIFPFMSEGRIVYLQGREKTGRKWNLGGSLDIYNRATLEEGEPGEEVFIVEGITDALSLEEIGKKAVAIQGAGGFKKGYLPLFRGFKVKIALDNDEAGEKPIQKLTELFYLDGQGVARKRPPDGVKDWNQYLQAIKKEL